METRKRTKTRKTSLHRGRTDRISVTHDLDLDLWPWLSIPWELWPWPTHMQTFTINGQSVPKIQWKQTDGQTDGGDRITSRAIAVSNKTETWKPMSRDSLHTWQVPRDSITAHQLFIILLSHCCLNQVSVCSLFKKFKLHLKFTVVVCLALKACHL